MGKQTRHVLILAVAAACLLAAGIGAYGAVAVLEQLADRASAAGSSRWR